VFPALKTTRPRDADRVVQGDRGAVCAACFKVSCLVLKFLQRGFPASVQLRVLLRTDGANPLG
jgi:hypothetical protein